MLEDYLTEQGFENVEIADVKLQNVSNLIIVSYWGNHQLHIKEIKQLDLISFVWAKKSNTKITKLKTTNTVATKKLSSSGIAKVIPFDSYIKSNNDK